MWMMKNIDFKWTENHQQKFEQLKHEIIKAPILTQFKPGSPIIIRPDYSKFGIGGVVLQEEEDGPKPLLFFGRILKPAETRYSTIEGECLAVVTGFQKARIFILPATLVTSHD